MEENGAMDFSTLLRPAFACSCGQTHQCQTRAIHIGKGALEEIPQFLAGCSRVLVVSDANTKDACGERVVTLLQGAGFTVREACFEQRTPVEPDERAVAFFQSQIGPEIEAVVGVGGGVINDLTKLLSFQHGIFSLYVCTAPSMDGIATNTSVLTQRGLKFTVATQAPRFIVADLDVLCNAPLRLIRAGIGDVLGKYSALSDWRIAHLITGEPLCENVWHLVEEALQVCVKNIDGCMRREKEAIGRLFESLALIGVAAAYVRVSRPGSGAEHLLGHFFEIYGQVHNRPFLSHGENVGYCSLIVEALRNRLAHEDPSRFAYRFDKAAWEADIRRLFPPLAEEIFRMQNAADTYANRCAAMIAAWQQIQPVLLRTPGVQAIGALLRRAGFDCSEFLDLYGEALIRDGIRHCNDLKVKHTLFQLLADTGLLAEYATQIEL